MSAISFRVRDRGAVPRTGRIERWATAAGRGPGPYHLTDTLLAVFTVTMLLLMELWETEAVAPYQVLFLALTLVYGFRVWPLRPTLLVALVITLATGWIMVRHQLDGHIPYAELVEVPLLPLMFLVMAWHARRHLAARREIERMADQRRAVLDREREFFRDASHAIRTPVTIARGHLELLEPVIKESLAQEDLEIAMRQLDRMSALSNRLLALARLDAGQAVQCVPLNLTDLVEEVGRNWASSSDREWVIDCPWAGEVRADPEWLELAMDAVIENAVNFTGSGDRIRLSCRGDDQLYTISVADAGPGIASEDLPQVFERFWHRRPANGPMGSGLGLPMAKAAAHAHGGRIFAARSEDGGALIELVLPRDPATDSAASVEARVSVLDSSMTTPS
jgi:signal transduction histidine kinase